MKSVPLERALSKLGLASRTQAREWIEDGRVQVNGYVRLDPEYPVSLERARIEVDGARAKREAPRSFLLYKPRGVVTTRVDEKGRSTVFSLLSEKVAHLSAVGRLDLATTGLLILTNDTVLAAWLTEPANRVPRTYVVTVRGEVTEARLAPIRPGRVMTIRKASGKESHLVVILHGGKNREIREMFGSIGHEVTSLKRVSYGGLELGPLQPGEYRELSCAELRRAFPKAPVATR